MHIILHASLFFVKYILSRKYILNYKLRKQNTDNKRVEEGDEIERAEKQVHLEKIKFSHTPQHTQTQVEGRKK